ncbi:TolC family protein [Sulfurirhabdus autotrophica]|uniref:Cobalt-zinc-cadmium efflux system outer membrane protein n=1 Tax=Sulfurirhabdus autotrophica TaxID=1706046 RepID=A0A4R3YCU7_9PROT|nr:TolC family protein [Sulfurirhabdus autotrophica]TCV89681.1 cobalt-zinc-cadmium efflux system outer membrane protein [Sulfurirhabdus autotrophica]
MLFRIFCVFFAFFALLLSKLSNADQMVGLQKLSLEQAIQIAEEYNHDLRLSVSSVASAGAAKIIASAAPNPMLTIQTFNINPAAGIGAGNLRNKTVDSTIRIDQLIERGGKREFRTENAADLEEAARKDMEDMHRQLRVNVSQAYYDLLAAEQKREITRQTVSLYESTVTAAQKRQKAGDISLADVARLQVDAMAAQNDVTQAEADIAKAKQALALVLGQTASASAINLTDSWPAIKFNDVEPSAVLIEQRSDVLAAKARLEAALATRKLARASRSRDVSVGVQYEHFPASDSNPQGSGNSYGIAVQVPLFARYSFDGEIKAAEAAVTQAQENLEKTRDMARNDLANSWQDARASYLRVKQYEDGLLAAAKKSSDAAEFAYKNGALGVMDVLDARRTLRATQLDALAARANFAKSVAAMQAAVALSENNR